MKLAEALQERADCNRRIAQLRSRLQDNAQMQEGEQPAQDPVSLLKELDETIVRLEQLIAQINLTNAKTMYQGESLTAWIARKDALTLKIEAYQSLITEASQTVYRARNSEIRILPSVNVKELQKQTDELSKQLRQLNNTIQQINWTTEI